MLAFQLVPWAGTNFTDCVVQAIKIANALDCEVKFIFNGQKIKVCKDSDIDSILADYQMKMGGHSWNRVARGSND